jgi:hypothetical protein
MKFDAKKAKAVSLIASGLKCRMVAEELGVTPQTISEWKKQPEFAAESNKLRLETLEAASAKIQDSVIGACDILVRVMQEAPSFETRRKAALDIMRLAGFEPGSQQSYAWGIGPRTADGVRQATRRENAMSMLISNRAAKD